MRRPLDLFDSWKRKRWPTSDSQPGRVQVCSIEASVHVYVRLDVPHSIRQVDDRYEGLRCSAEIA